MSTIIYNSEITDADLVDQFTTQVSQEVISSDNLVDASYPMYLTEIKDNNLDSNNYQTEPITSGIPQVIDNLWNYSNKVEKNFEPVSSIVKLFNTLKEDVTLTDNYNGICVDLNTTGYNLKVDKGSVMVAL